jgi:hypothetical protein
MGYLHHPPALPRPHHHHDPRDEPRRCLTPRHVTMSRRHLPPGCAAARSAVPVSCATDATVLLTSLPPGHLANPPPPATRPDPHNDDDDDPPTAPRHHRLRLRPVPAALPRPAAVPRLPSPLPPGRHQRIVPTLRRTGRGHRPALLTPAPTHLPLPCHDPAAPYPQTARNLTLRPIT